MQKIVVKVEEITKK